MGRVGLLPPPGMAQRLCTGQSLISTGVRESECASRRTVVAAGLDKLAGGNAQKSGNKQAWANDAPMRSKAATLGRRSGNGLRSWSVRFGGPESPFLRESTGRKQPCALESPTSCSGPPSPVMTPAFRRPSALAPPQACPKSNRPPRHLQCDAAVADAGHWLALWFGGREQRGWAVDWLACRRADSAGPRMVLRRAQPRGRRVGCWSTGTSLPEGRLYKPPAACFARGASWGRCEPA